MHLDQVLSALLLGTYKFLYTLAVVQEEPLAPQTGQLLPVRKQSASLSYVLHTEAIADAEVLEEHHHLEPEERLQP